MKKVISVIVVMLLLTATAFAASRNYDTIANGKLNIVIDGGLAKNEAIAGSEVSVKINLVNNTTISSVKIELTLDERLSVVAKSSGKPDVNFGLTTSDSGAIVLSNSTYDADNHKLLLNWATLDGEVLGDATFATVKIKVADNVEPGTFLPITATANPNDIFDIDIHNIDFKLINGGIDVINILKGDVDGDGSLTDKDVIFLAKHVNGTTPAGFVAEAADYNGDKAVDKKDVSALFAAVCEYEYALPSTERVFTTVPSGKFGIVVDGGEAENVGMKGKNVEVKIKLKNSPGISSLKAVVYWPEQLKLVDVKYDINDASDKTSVINTASDWSKVSGSFAFSWASGTKEVKGNAAFVTLTFTVSESAEDGAFLYTAITADNVYSASGSAVTFMAVNGGVDVKNVLLGDANGDGQIDNKDVVLLFRFVSGTVSGSALVLAAADFNGDKEIDNKDVVALFRYVSAH